MQDQEQDELQQMIGRLDAKQRNILWPRTKSNSRGIDAFLWRGAEKPIASMRIVAVVFGLFFIAAALGFAAAAAEEGSVLMALFSFGWLYLGGRVLFNSIPKDPRTKD